MILNIEGKNIVFGMRWKPMLSGLGAAKEARQAKSAFMWHQEKEKALSLGLMAENEKRENQKQPLYAGAIAFARMHPETPNMMLVLSVPDSEAYIICAVRQGRPRDKFDAIVENGVDVNQFISNFTDLCDTDSFLLFGDAPIEGIHPLTLKDLARSADQHSQLKKVTSGFVNPIFIAVAVIIIGVVGYESINFYTNYRKEQRQKAENANKKSVQQLYAEELILRRQDIALSAAEIRPILLWARNLPISVGGWNLHTITCNVAVTNKIACGLDYTRSKMPSATNKTFVENSIKMFEGIEFGETGKLIHTTAAISDLKFSTVGAAIDASLQQKDEVIEFGSSLQALSALGDQKLLKYEPFALPAGASASQLTQLPILSAAWEFNGPVRALELLASFPRYVTVKQFVLTLNATPNFEYNGSFATAKITGTVYSKQI